MTNSQPNSERNGESRLLDRIDLIPPFVLYYMARLSKRRHSHPGIEWLARESGLSTATVVRLSRRLTWAGVTFDTFERFCRACGVNFMVSGGGRHFIVLPHLHYLRGMVRGKLSKPLYHLSPRQTKNFNKLCEKWTISSVPPVHTGA